MEHQYKISKQLDAYIETYVKNSEYNAYSEEDLEGLIVLKGVIYSGSVVLDEDDIFLEVLASMQEEQPCINANGNATLAEYIRLDDFVAPLTRDELIAGILNEEAIADLDSKYSNSLHLKDKIEKELSALEECCIYNFSEDYEYMIVHPSTYKVEFVEIEEDIPDGCSCYKTEQFISKGYDYNDYDRKIFHGYQFNEVPIWKFTELDFMLNYDEYPDRFYDHISNLSDYYEYERECDEDEELDAYSFIQFGDEQFESGDFEYSKINYQIAMDKEPLYAFYCYYRIGWIEALTGNYEEALNCYNKGIALKDDYAYLYLNKGDLLKKHLGRKPEAEICYRKCIELEEDKIEEGICWHHACAELGLRDQAVEIMSRMLEKFPDEAGYYFDAACMYCTLNEYDQALEYLETCLNMGYSVQHVLFDPEIDAIRDTDKYKEIISKYTEEYSGKSSEVDDDLPF